VDAVMPVALTNLQECAVVGREDRPAEPLIHPTTIIAYSTNMQL